MNQSFIRLTRRGKTFREIASLVKFGVVGAVGSLIMLGITYGLTEYAGLYYLASYVIGFGAAVLSSYFLNTLWSFRQKIKIHALLWYVAINCFTILINTGVVAVATTLGLWYIFSATIGIIVAFLLNYRSSRRLVWKVLPMPNE